QGAKTAHHLHEQPVDTLQSRATLGRTNKHKRLPATGNHSHATGLLTRQYTGDDIQTVLAEMLLINQAAPTRVLANESARISSTLKRLQAHHHESLLVGTMHNKRIGPIDQFPALREGQSEVHSRMIEALPAPQACLGGVAKGHARDHLQIPLAPHLAATAGQRAG